MQLRHLIFIPAIIFFVSNETYSQDFNLFQSSRSSAIGNASVALIDLWCINNNQAGLALINHKTIGLTVNNKFLISKLNNTSLGIALPTNSGTFGFSASFFGYSLYNENKFSVGFGKKLSKKISSGIQLNYFSAHSASENSRRMTLVGEAGFLFRISNKLIIGTHLFNPTYNSKSNNTKLALPTVLRIGFNYNFSEKVFSYLEVEKNIESKNRFKSGLTYQPNNVIRLSAGISTNPTLIAFGFGIAKEHLQFDISFMQHQVLGTSPQFSMQYEF
ncbi:MAG: hypothetical protein HRT71_12215 [Flavobacteriales bacterium]|nr:hypothetical protein [Flavobacteriales bacterium]